MDEFAYAHAGCWSGRLGGAKDGVAAGAEFPFVGGLVEGLDQAAQEGGALLAGLLKESSGAGLFFFEHLESDFSCVVGRGHVVTFVSADSCVDEHVTRFFC